MNQLEIYYKSNLMMTRAPLCVLLPEVPYGENAEDFYAGKKRYPVLWLLHGATEDYNSWLQNCRLQKNLSGHGLIVVMPNGWNSDFANHMQFGTGYAYADFFFKELMPFIYGTFPASAKPEDNYIAGFSMGGAGALMLGLLHPENFGGISPMGSSVRESAFLKPYLSMTGEAFRKMASANPALLPTEYGNPENGITPKEINMISRYETVQHYVDSMECTIERFNDALQQKKQLPEIFFCCGTQDSCYPKVLEFVACSNKKGADNVCYEALEGLDHSHAEEPFMAMIKHFNL